MRKYSLVALVLAASALLARPAIADGAPVITSPSANATVPGAGAVHFTGTATPGVQVDLVDTSDGSTVGSTPADTTGSWELNQPLTDGAHTVYAMEHGGLPGDSVSFIVDAVRPTVKITSPKDQTIFQPGQSPALTGTANDDRGVLAVQIEYWLINKLALKKNVPCDGCGTGTATWNDVPALPLPGYYVAKVTSIDTAGNRSDTTQITFFDSGVHDSPAIPQTPNSPQLPKPPVIQTPNPGSSIPGVGSDPSTGTPVTIGGVAQPGETINVYDVQDGDWMGKTVSDGNSGRWSVLVHTTGGVYGIQASATNAQGRTSPLSVRVTFRVDNVRPDVQIQQDTSDPKIFLPTQQVQLHGSTADDVKVVAVNLQYWLGSKLVLIENAQCPACGGKGAALWTDTPHLANPGYYYVNIVSIDEAGNHSITDSIRFIKTV